MAPKVSILMSVYNGEKYLSESINSILNQTFEDFELIIVNDASTDNSLNILKQYDDKRIFIINNKKNIGLTKSLNKALKVARGIYIARMDADDISKKTRIEKQVKFMDAYPEIGVLGSNYYEMDTNGNRLISKINIPETDEQIRKVLFKYNPFIHSSLMIRKSVLDKIGYYDESFKASQDYDLILRILAKYPGHNLKEELVVKTIDFNSISFKKLRTQVLYSIKARLKALKTLNYNKKYFFYLWRPLLRYIFASHALKREIKIKKPV